MSQESSFTFTTPLNVNVVEIKGEEHLFVEGDISTNDIDLVNDVMTENCQKSMQRQIMERNMKLDLEHEAFKGSTHEEKEISKTKIPAGKIIDATVKDLGNGRYSTSIKGEINRHNPNYATTKGNLLEKYLDAFSVAFLATDVTYTQKEGKSVRLLNDVRLLNVALTGNPCNTSAQLSNIFTKSMDAVEDYKALKELDPSIEGMLEVKTAEDLKYKYAKRTGSPGHYIYWYKNPKTGKLEGRPDKQKEPSSGKNEYRFDEERLERNKQSKKEVTEKIDKAVNVAVEEISERIGKEGLSNTQAKYVIDYEVQEGKISEVLSKLDTTGEAVKIDVRNAIRRGINRIFPDFKNIEEDISNSTDHKAGEQLNNQKISKKMTDKNIDQKSMEANEQLKSMSEEMKSIKESNEAVIKDNAEVKESVSKMAETLKGIVEALNKPVHKSLGVQKSDAEAKAKPEAKSVDPLELCY